VFLRTDHAEAIRDLQFDELLCRVALVDPRPICHIRASKRQNDMGLSSATRRNMVSLSLVLLQNRYQRRIPHWETPLQSQRVAYLCVTSFLSTLQVKVCAYQQDGPAAACGTA
jgi:hypothetical protein